MRVGNSLAAVVALCVGFAQAAFVTPQSSLSQTTTTATSTPCFVRLSMHDGNHDNDNASSVGDYVRGVHGGKYQFDTPGGISFEGQQFVEALYSGSQQQQEEESLEEEPLPNWAMRLQSSVPPTTATTIPELVIKATTKTMVTIQNEERSWERFYAFILVTGGGPKDVVAAPNEMVVVEPRVGQLAPRGGANSYSDKATLSVSIQPNSSFSSFPSSCDWWLVIGTEADTWRYRLRVEHP